MSAGKTYYIREKMSGNYLTVKDGGTGNETPVVLQEFSGSTSQKWKLVQNNNGQYQLVPQHAQNMCLDLKAASDTDQAVIQVAVKTRRMRSPGRSIRWKTTPTISAVRQQRIKKE